jgi:hypothetical protein
MTSELDPQARALIGLALQGEQRLPRHRERVRRGVLAALAAPAALGATDAALAAGKAAGVVAGATATGTKASLFASAVWLKAAPLVAFGAAAGILGVQQLPSRTPPERVEAPAAASAPAPAPRTPAVVAPAPAEVAPAPAPAPPGPVAPAPAPLKAGKPSAALPEAAPVSAAAPPSLATELEALQRAQRALNAGNAAGALGELRATSGQALLAERTAVEVFAHCALGNVSAAREKASLFRQLAPRSPLLPRVNASCAGE